MNSRNWQAGRWVDGKLDDNKWVDARDKLETDINGTSDKDFIDRMYAIHNIWSSKTIEKDADGNDVMEHGYPKVIAKEGLTMADFKSTMLPWIREFTMLKDEDNL